MDVPQIYPDKRLRLEVRRVRHWKGTARGREGQAITWVTPDKLSRYSMPPADLPVVAALRQPCHYLVTPEPTDGEDAWLASIEAAIAGGIRRIQLRTPMAAQREALARTVVERFGKQVEVLINRDIALASALGVGVHLGSEQLLQLQARPLPESMLVAASCHDLAQLQAAQQLGCDFAVLGPVQATATHPDAVSLGWDAFVELRERVSLPIYAIGGMGAGDVETARRHGALGVAAIRALWPQA
ncbi:MAG: Nudix family hydrolase, partial [Stenotrophomonas sp.]